MPLDALRDAAAREVGYKEVPWRVAVRDEVLQMLRYWSDLATKYDLPYFIINGTLLGASKFNGIIPYDDDADIAVLYKDVSKVLTAIKTTLANTPYTFTEVAYGYILRGPTSAMLDIIVFDQDPTTTNTFDPVYRMCYPIVAGKPTFWLARVRILDIKTSMLYPLRQYKFDDLTLWGPYDDKAICLMTYGNDVYTVNKRPDKGLGIHPITPAILGFLQPVVQGLANTLIKLIPNAVEQTLRLKWRQRKL